IPLARIERHDDLFQRRIPRSFTNSVNGTLDLTRAILDCGKTVGNRQSEIIVTVRADGDAIGILQTFAERANELSVFRRCLITDGIRYIDDRRARVDHGVEDRAEVIDLGATRILRRKFDLVAELARALDSFDGEIESFAPALVQLV